MTTEEKIQAILHRYAGSGYKRYSTLLQWMMDGDCHVEEDNEMELIAPKYGHTRTSIIDILLNPKGLEICYGDDMNKVAAGITETWVRVGSPEAVDYAYEHLK
jgi:hypothetical protein